MKKIHFAGMTLFALLSSAGCAAPTDATSGEESHSSSEALTGPTLSTAGSDPYGHVVLSGSGFTSGGNVQIKVWGSSGWQPFKTVRASVGQICVHGYCRSYPPAGGNFSMTFDVNCGSAYSYTAVDVTSGQPSGVASLNTYCPAQ